jgi:uncharacterized membrane protein YphA (DoxX/SURF4 family)
VSRLLRWRGHAWLAVPARWYLGYVFLTACWHKILHPGSFALDIATYDILPLSLVNAMAIVLPYVEIVAAVCLLAGVRVRPAALLVCGMMVVFTVAIWIALEKGLDMSCGCFASQGAEEDPISWKTVLRDLGWLALGIYVLLFDRCRLGIERWLGARAGAAPVEAS